MLVVHATFLPDLQWSVIGHFSSQLPHCNAEFIALQTVQNVVCNSILLMAAYVGSL